jgi:CheY-like chemotaxis protein
MVASTGNVLIIDDEDSLRYTLTRVLKAAGCEVSGAADGQYFF